MKCVSLSFYIYVSYILFDTLDESIKLNAVGVDTNQGGTEHLHGVT